MAHHSFELAVDDPQALAGDGGIGRAGMRAQKVTIQSFGDLIFTSGKIRFCTLQKRRLFLVITCATRDGERKGQKEGDASAYKMV